MTPYMCYKTPYIMQKSLRVQEKTQGDKKGELDQYPTHTYTHRNCLFHLKSSLLHIDSQVQNYAQKKKDTHAFPPHIGFKTGSMNIKHQNHTNFDGNQTRSKHRFASIGGNGENNPRNRFSDKEAFFISFKTRT